jgi:hypothetical protein
MPTHRGFATRQMCKDIQHPDGSGENPKLTGGSKKGHKGKGHKGQSKHDKIMENSGWPTMPIGGDGAA